MHSNMRIIAPSTPASMAVLLAGALAAISTGLGAGGLKQQLLATAAPTELFVPHGSEKLTCATPLFNEMLDARGSTNKMFLPDPLAYPIVCSLFSSSIFFVAGAPARFAALASACVDDDACSAAADHQILHHPRLPFPRPTVTRTCNVRGKIEAAAPSVWPTKPGHGGNADVNADLVQLLMPSEGIDATGRRHVFDSFTYYYMCDISFLLGNNNPAGNCCMPGFLLDNEGSGVTRRKKSSAGCRSKSSVHCTGYIETEMHGKHVCGVCKYITTTCTEYMCVCKN